MIIILVLIGIGTIFFLGLLAGIQHQDRKRELDHRRRVANLRARSRVARML